MSGSKKKRSLPVRRVARPLLALLLGLVALLMTACGSSGSSSSSPVSQTGPTAAAKLVPPEIKSMGTLQVPTSADLPPIEFFAADNKTITGLDVDMGNAIASHLGLKFDFVSTGFDTIIPSLLAGKYQLAMAGIIDTPAREKVVQIIPYFQDSVNFLVKSDSPGIESLSDLCGHTVGVQSGSAYVETARKQDATCKSEGKPGVSVQVFSKQTDANLAVSSGRIDATMNDAPLNGYQAQQANGTFKTSGTPFGKQVWGIALPKDSTFGPAIVAALKEMMKNGEYQEILKKWGAPPSSAEVTPQVKGA